VAAVLMAELSVFFRHTLTGKAMQAISINPSAAQLVGVGRGRMLALAFALAAAVSAVGGAVSAPIVMPRYDTGLLLGLKGFVGATLGGLGSGPGAVAGGLLVGLTEALVAGYLSSSYKDAVPFLMIIGVLLFMPHGLFGTRQVDRV
jgi:branched-subunit amino acid ABC-type transport system permease component